MTHAETWEELLRQEIRSSMLHDLIARKQFEDRFGVSAQTIRVESEVLSTDFGTGFKTILRFSDNSVIETRKCYLTDDKENIVFETRGSVTSAVTN